MALLGPNGEPVVPAPAPSQTPEEPQVPERVITAFLVYQTPAGQWVVTSDLAEAIVPMRKPGMDDIYGGAANIQAEIAATKTATMSAAKTVQTQMAVARQMQGQTMSPAEQAAVAASQGRGAGR